MTPSVISWVKVHLNNDSSPSFFIVHDVSIDAAYDVASLRHLVIASRNLSKELR